MTKKNKNTCVRGGKCQCSRIDNQITSSVQESAKSAVENSGCNHQEVSNCSDSTLTKKGMIMPLTEGLCSLKDAVLENGIKYILHVFCIYLVNEILSTFLGSEKHIETKHAKPCNENHKKQNKWKQINQKSTRQKMENNNSNGRPLKKHQNVVKDSDSSRNQSSNATNVTAINMPLNYKKVDNSISHIALEKPTDISTEKHSLNETPQPINISPDTESFTDEQSNAIQNKFSKSHTQKQYSNSSENKEMTQMFRRKFASTDSSSSFPKSFASYKYKRSKRTNFFYNGGNRKVSNNSLIKSQLKKSEKEQKKELSVKFAPTNEKEKSTFDKEESEKHTEQRYKKEAREKKRSYRQYDSTKYKNHHSRKHVGHRESKRNNRKCVETGTQTDIAFPMDCDVELVSVGTKWPTKKFYSYSTRKFQDRDMNEELKCTADNKKSEKKLLTNAYQQMLSYNTSSSSTDPGSDARISTTPDADTDILAKLWYAKLFNSINTSKTTTRAPPGFSEIPQNPPLVSRIHNSEDLKPPSLKDDYDPNSHIKAATAVSTAPPPMRHLYYNYPEFMELPTYNNSSNTSH